MAEITHTTTDPETGHTLVHYASGVIRDQDAGRLIAGPTDPALNPVRADPRGMQVRRHEIAEAAAWEAANRTATELIQSGEVDYITIEKAGPAPVIAALTSKLTRLLLLAKTGREAEGIIAPWMRLLGLGPHKIEVENTVKHEVTEAAAGLIKALMEVIKPDAAEGEVIE